MSFAKVVMSLQKINKQIKINVQIQTPKCQKINHIPEAKVHNTNLREYKSNKESLSSTIGNELTCAGEEKTQNEISIKMLNHKSGL